jgi:hypothetical protein
MNLKQAGSGAEVDERLAALLTNSSAVRAITASVEGTIAPRASIRCWWTVSARLSLQMTV